MRCLRAWILLEAILVAMMLIGCGGGDAAPGDSASGIEVVSVPSDSYKELSVAQADAASFSGNASVDLPNSAQLQPGNVVAVKGKAVKLVSIESGAASGMTRYGFTAARLDDLFKKLTLNGAMSISSATVVAPAGSMSTVRPLSHLRSLGLQKEITCGLVKVDGVNCSFSISPPGLSFVSFAGTVEVTGKVDFKSWDVIDNTGSGEIDIGYSGDISVNLKKKTPSLLTGDDVCSSTREEVVGTRARIFTVVLPTSVPSISVRMPICLAADAQAGIVGKFFQFKHQGTVKIAVGDNSFPRLVSQIPAGSATDRASDDESWLLENTETSLAIAPIDVSAKVSLAPEIAFEIAAGLANHPDTTVAALGLVSTFTGSASATGKFAWVENFGKTIAALSIDPLYCLNLGVAVDYQLTVYASLPGFSLFLDKELLASRAIFSDPWPIWSKVAPIGKCDLKVDTQTTITSMATSNSKVDFSVKVVKNDAKSGRLWDDRHPLGTVNITDPLGTTLCVVTLAAGQGSCSYLFPGEPMSLEVVGKYAGDEHFRPGVSGQATSVVNKPGFTKISATGAELPADATTWSCVRHNATGLLWEAHVTRDVPMRLCSDAPGTTLCNGFTNFGDGRAYDASEVPATVGSLCGKTGWRLPTDAEGQALVGDASYPVGNTTNYYVSFHYIWFGRDDIANAVWTSSPDPYPDFAGVIFFTHGVVDANYRGYAGYFVRLVAGP